MPLTVRKFNAQVKDPQSGQMVPAGLLSSDSLQAIEAAESSAITAIQQKGQQTQESIEAAESSAITAIQQKGAETKADIPDDYTELSNSVGELKESLNEHIDDFDTAMDGIIIPGTEVAGNIIIVDSSAGEIEKITVDASGADTSVITRCGKNIFPKFTSGSSSGLSWTVDDDGLIEFTGTPTANVLLRHQNLSIPCTGKAFALAANNTMSGTAAQLTIVCQNPVGNWQTNLTSINKTNIHAVYQSSEAQFTEIIIKLTKDIDWTGLKMKPMLVVGDTLGDFEPYNGQTYNVTLVDGVVQEDISLLDGTNTIWASNGNLSIQFKDTPVSIADYIADITALPNLANAPKLRLGYGQKNSFYRIYKNGSSTYVYIYYVSGEKIVGWELHNVPAAASNSNTWQIGHVMGYDFDGVTLSNGVELVSGGEFELAFKEYNAADYCGGNNHGDENMDDFTLTIDGKTIDLSNIDDNFHVFDRIDAIEHATINRCNTPSENILKHQKIWTFENGTVKARQSLEFLESLECDFLCCMLTANRSAFTYGVRQGRVGTEIMTTSSFNKISTSGNEMMYLMYGTNATAKVTAKCEEHTPVASLWINGASTVNKLYYNFYGQMPRTSVESGTVVKWESEYDIAYN